MASLHLPHNHGGHSAEIFERVPATGEFQLVADIFKLLGDSSRVRIFWLLCHTEECVINLSAMVEMSSPAVSHHLRQLKSAGLIVARRDGKEVYYRAADTRQAAWLHHDIERLIALTCPTQPVPESGSEAEAALELPPPSPPQTCSGDGAIQAVHDFLTEHLDTRYTIEALSRQFLMDSTSLKLRFKAQYGKPIASYMREYRMQRAQALLRSTNASIAEIAAQLGYTTQGKFSAAFQAETGLLPKEYRKQP